MKKQIKKLQLKRNTVVLLSVNEKNRLNTGKAAKTAPHLSCPFRCTPMAPVDLQLE
jgi:hypothetical protein